MQRNHQPFINREIYYLFQFCAVIIIIGILISNASKHYLTILKISTSTAALASSGPLKSEIHAFYVKYGYWPDNQHFKQLGEYINNTVTDIIIEKGSFHLYFNKKFNHDSNSAPQVLSFRKAQFQTQLDTPIWWICGYSEVPEGMITNVKNKTTIDKKYLHKVCQ